MSARKYWWLILAKPLSFGRIYLMYIYSLFCIVKYTLVQNKKNIISVIALSSTCDVQMNKSFCIRNIYIRKKKLFKYLNWTSHPAWSSHWVYHEIYKIGYKMNFKNIFTGNSFLPSFIKVRKCKNPIFW